MNPLRKHKTIVSTRVELKSTFGFLKLTRTFHMDVIDIKNNGLNEHMLQRIFLSRYILF